MKKQSKSLSNVHGDSKVCNLDEDLRSFTLKSKQGLYIGESKTFASMSKDTSLTVAGARSGKGVNLIIPNLLGASDYQGSWVVIDPKGENTAITAHYQQQSGRKVLYP